MEPVWNSRKEDCRQPAGLALQRKCSIPDMLGNVRSISVTYAHTVGKCTEFSSSTRRAFEEILEFCELLQERQLHNSDRAVPLLRDDEFRFADILIVRLVDLFAIDEHDDVGVLFNGTRFAKIGQLWPMIA